MEDQQIITLYWARSEDAIAETSRKYGRYCHTIAYNILQNESDSEECVNDTYWRIWKMIPPKRPVIFSAMLAKVTRNLALDRRKYYSTEKRGGNQTDITLDELKDCIPVRKTEDEIIEKQLLVDALNHFLKGLSQEVRTVFMLRYWYFCSIRQIADELGRSESYVKMTLMRTRKQLKIALEKEGIAL